MDFIPAGPLKEPIAIVGSACRLPGDASSPSKLWTLLMNPTDLLTEIPADRFNADKFYHPDPHHHGTSNVRHSYLLTEDHRWFDAAFFDVKPREANAIDPQQRILLETTYEALEAAGMPLNSIKGSPTGVFVGLMNSDYASITSRDVQGIPTYYASGTSRSTVANRLSYFFDLQGPSMTVDTACSSSMVALHQAVLSLRSGESKCALVAGANLLLTPEPYIASSNLNMLSSSGRSRMWDSKADGYGRGDGFVVVVLKTLSQALSDHDSIECIIRETAVNQDGRTKGITMPSATAQAQLIRQAYASAGLDLSTDSGRPQLFEAHGTGTPTGDPIEAEAISSAFFAPGVTAPPDMPLVVGSIKTVIGHTEGAAGLAGLLKASLAIQHGLIPPNLLLDELNPKVRPFCDHLKVPQEVTRWPRTTATRRASVNSFGFGGTNSHVILENFIPSTAEPLVMLKGASTGRKMLFVFSAASPTSLKNQLKSYAALLQQDRQINLRDLAWTLRARRSVLAVRTFVVADTIDTLRGRLDSAIFRLTESVPSKAPTVSRGSKSSRILGIFTGQGAQWAAMGSCLLRQIPLASTVLKSLQQSLDTLPPGHAPDWSLRDELLKTEITSRLEQAQFAQPVCTAVQLVLIELLKAIGVELSAVVGHSSGEIAAAVAAGYISSHDAIRIAYYRGFSLTASPDTTSKQAGGMLAVATSASDARALCTLPSLRGRVSIAAINSPASITLSGDLVAIEDVGEIMSDEDKFSKLLNVNQAYHSQHMISYSEYYSSLLRSCHVRVISDHDDNNKPGWISSVSGKQVTRSDCHRLAESYWVDNMVQPVLFHDAVSQAATTFGPFDVLMEVGPHTALKRYLSETMISMGHSPGPYVSTLKRSENDLEAFVGMLGVVWEVLGPDELSLDGYQKLLEPDELEPPRVLKGLPTYPWDHQNIYRHETRQSRAFVLNGTTPRGLIGSSYHDEPSGERRYTSRLSIRDIPWLQQHQVLGRAIFPAAAFIAAFVQAVCNHDSSAPEAQFVEIYDFTIVKAIEFSHEDEDIEANLTIQAIKQTSGWFEAIGSFYSHNGEHSTTMHKNATARLRWTHDVVKEPLPRPTQTRGEMLSIQPGAFYEELHKLGHGYQGPFRGLVEIRRRVNEATGSIIVPDQPADIDELLLHPATLDCALQSMMLAYSYPGDGEMRTIYLPTRVDVLHIDISALRNLGSHVDLQLPFYTAIQPSSHTSPGMIGNIEIASPDNKSIMIQVQGLHATPLIPPAASKDIDMFFDTTWTPETPTGRQDLWSDAQLSEKKPICTLLERIAYYYLRKLGSAFQANKRDKLLSHHRHFLNWVDNSLARVAANLNPYVQREWADDSDDIAEKIIEQHSYIIDMKLMSAVGCGLLQSIKSRGNILEAMMQDEMLTNFYSNSLGMREYLEDMGRMAGQLGQAYSNLNVIEIGAGVGAATCCILPHLGESLGTYTYTDISSGFFQSAKDRFRAYQPRMSFQVLDIEQPIESQGFADGSYDLIVASLVLHATRDLHETLLHCRSLLKPGGFLLMLEITDNDPLRLGLIFGGLHGWWRGYQSGRTSSPCVSEESWGDLMVESGFTKALAVTPHNTFAPFPISVMMYQSLDDRMRLIRQPTAPGLASPKLRSLTILGNKELSAGVFALVHSHYQSVRQIDTVDCMSSSGLDLPYGDSVLSLVDLDSDTNFMVSSSIGFDVVKHIYRQAKLVLWVTARRQSQQNYSGMMKAFHQSLTLEQPEVYAYTLNFPFPFEIGPKPVAERLLQIEAYLSSDNLSGTMASRWGRELNISIQNGQVMVPRLRPNVERNKRYNSSRKMIMRYIRSQDHIISLTGGAIPTLSAVKIPSDNSANVSAYHEVILEYSLVESVYTTKDTAGFLSIGRKVKTDEPIVIISKSLDSRVFVPSVWMLSAPEDSEQGLEVLIRLESYILALRILELVKSRRNLVVIDPHPCLAQAMGNLCTRAAVELLILHTVQGGHTTPKSYIHPRASRWEFIKRVPTTRPFVILDADRFRPSSLLMLQKIPPNGHRIEFGDLVSPITHLESDPISIRDVSDHLQSAWMNCVRDKMHPTDLAQRAKLGLAFFAQTKLPSNIPAGAIVAWQDSAEVPIPYQPASAQVAFQGDKSYWLIGLAGGLGRSFCQWMAERGAKQIALSSRTPQVSLQWLDEMKSKGCNISIFSCDVADRQSLETAYREIVTSMPPIAGVMQGAMVLHDQLFLQMEYKQALEVLRPKVTGSILLDEIFSDNNLDFYIYLSSLASIVGNPGQTIYAVANAFMAGQAAHRRERGLAASIIHIAGIKGEGYVARSLSREKELALQKGGFPFIPLRALHEALAEAILSSPSSAASDFEISTIMRIKGENQDGDSFRSNPTFQHLIDASEAMNYQHRNAAQNLSIKEQLKETKFSDQLFSVMRDGLLAKIRASLQSELNDEVLLHSSPDRLGIDSLIAVDIQTWIKRELGVELLTLSILNAASLAEVVKQIRDSFIPQTEAGESATSGTSQSFDELTSSSSPEPPGLEDMSRPEPENSDTTDVEDAEGLPRQLSTELSIYDRSVRMSFSQARFWFLHQLVDDPSAFNVVSICTLHGSLDKTRLSQALRAVALGHEALRTAYFLDQTTKEPMQGVLPQSTTYLEIENLKDPIQLQETITELRGHHFDLTAGKTFRLKLLSSGTHTHHLFLSYHHISLDGIGHSLLLSSLQREYDQIPFKDNGAVLQYPDFALREQQQYESNSWEQDLLHWTQKFNKMPDPLPLLSLCRASSRPSSLGFTSHASTIRLSSQLCRNIGDCCQQVNVSAHHFYLAAFTVLLCRFSSVSWEDICIGITDGNRKDQDTLSCLGIFLNVLPLKLSCPWDQEFYEMLQNVKQEVTEAFSYSNVPIDVILSHLNVPRSNSHHPLFQALFNYRPNVREALELFGCRAQGELLSPGQNLYDVSVDVLNSATDTDSVTISLNASLYAKEDAQILCKSYEKLLQEFSTRVSTRLSTVSLYCDDDVLFAVNSGHGQELHSRWGGTLLDRIDHMIQKFPGRVAVEGSDYGSLLYSELNENAQLLTSEFVARGLGIGSNIGVFEVPGPDWIVSFLAILRAGAVCVPLDVDVGADRLGTIVDDSSPCLILVDRVTSKQSQFLTDRHVELLDISNFPQRYGTTQHVSIDTSHPAILTYTSGSTGVPKGVMVGHGSLRNFVEFAPCRWNLGSTHEIVLQQSSYAFDMAFCQILTSLANGYSLVVPSHSLRRDPAAIYSIVASQQVTFTIATPTEYLAWIRHGDRSRWRHTQWRNALSGGEAMTRALVSAFESLNIPNFALFNGYGPLETTFACADGPVPLNGAESDSDTFPLVPLPNYSISILDDNLLPVPPGVSGQVVIGGAGVSRGYLDSPHLTQSAFVHNGQASPYFRDHGWTIAHLSGDRGRIEKAGRLVIEGRMRGNEQVKLGGVRVNLADVEQSILTCTKPIVQQVAVSCRESSSEERFLVAFVKLLPLVADADSTHVLLDLPSRLPLPHYMRPSLFLAVDGIPMTVSNKIDRLAVDMMPLSSTPLPGTAEPSHQIQEYGETLDLWREVLPVALPDSRSPVSGDLDFFQSGGTSLSLIKLQSLVLDRLGLSIALSELFKASTIGQMTALLRLNRSHLQPQVIDWESEVAVSVDLPRISTQQSAIHVARPRPNIVVLTGATGFIGQEVLRRLVQTESITRIHCIAVRRVLEILPPLFVHEKVVVHNGDLETPSLGLTKEQVAKIFNEADLVIHIGAEVSLLKSYYSLKATNVASTQKLASLCLPRSIPLHFVSTATIAQLTDQEVFRPVSVAHYHTGLNVENGYLATKWVAEVWLEHFSKRTGLPAVIHRPSSVTGDHAPETDLMQSIMKVSRETKTVPDLSSWNGYLDFISVEAMAQILLDHVMSTAIDQGVRYVHESGEVQFPIRELGSVLQKEEGLVLDVLSFDDWLDAIERAGISVLLLEYLRKQTRDTVFPRIARD